MFTSGLAQQIPEMKASKYFFLKKGKNKVTIGNKIQTGRKDDLSELQLSKTLFYLFMYILFIHLSFKKR